MSKRKEQTQKKGIISDYYETTVYYPGYSDKTSKGVGKTKEESRENAYKKDREKNK